jgi:ribosomal protein S18 acetylase RimI-like enzyme
MAMQRVPTVEVRTARAGDMGVVRAWAADASAWGIPPGRDATPTEVRERTLAAVADLEKVCSQSPTVVLLVAEEQSDTGPPRILGYILLDLASVEPATGEPQCFIADLGVERGVWGRGVAHHLCEAACRLAAARGLTYLVGVISSHNRRALDIALGDLEFHIERHQIMRRCGPADLARESTAGKEKEWGVDSV